MGSFASNCLGGTPRAFARSADNASDFLSRECLLRCLTVDSLFRPRWSSAWARIASGSWMKEGRWGLVALVCVEKGDVRILGSSCTWSHGTFEVRQKATN